ncbi:efflux RND transporter periplasmic adaptor subunit [Ferrimonas lipolytica]|uniref:Efflux RND transporter periplasmic adaptor subunit n=1 Tax=Ferrimonas lipolytica TaxID=2724191 RepID=A0A6H1UGK5_9GAMM|nr:efflux RND transporter periplasmic adaptor subunit [Ferrimonas lipolytica]QIZ77453.1 efflux RND transporter periplasmic adaptor subunit [Ferrimonas lipolytica]
MGLWIRRLLPMVTILVAIMVIALLLAKFAPEKEKKAVKQSLPIVNVVAVEPQSFQLSLQSYGVVEPKRQTQLVAEVSGRLIQLAPEFVVGQFVRKGQLLAHIEPADYQADLIQAEANLAQANAQLEEEIARGRVAKEEWQGVIEGIPPELGLRKPQLAQEKANVRSAEAGLARAQRNLERTQIRAPFDGMISSRSVDLGQYINISNNLGIINGTDVAQIRLPVAPDELNFLDSVNSGEVVLSHQVGSKTLQWQATLVRSEGEINPDNRMIYLVAEMSDPYNLTNKHDQSLQYGAFVNARIEGINVDGLVNLPRHAVRGGRITVVKPDNTIELRSVDIVRADLEQVYFRANISNGERLSLNALNGVDNGRKVKVAGEKLPDDAPQDSSTNNAQMATVGTQ